MAEKSFRPKPTNPAYNFWTLNRLLDRSIEDNKTGCRVWQGRINKPGGYGRIGYREKQWRAHRLFYTLMVGEIPSGMDLLHACDNPLCINPNHLRPGTPSENIAEAYEKGRKKSPQGPKSPRFRLTEAQAHEAITSSETVAAMAQRFGVSKSVIYRLKNGSTWKERTKP